MNWTAAAALILTAGLLPASTVVSSFHEGNSIFLRLSDGSAQVEWISESSFRFSRRWDASFIQRPPLRPPIAIKISDTPEHLKISTKYLLMMVAKRGVTVQVAEPDGTPIMVDASEPQSQDGVLAWERMASRDARFYGLGARDDATINLRGTRTAAQKPFLISTAGYGEFHVAPGTYSFDLARAKTDRYRIEARHASIVDYYFFFGPGPKEILEQYLLSDGPIQPLGSDTFRLLAPAKAPARISVLQQHSVPAAIHSLINGSLSGVLLPALSLDTFQSIPLGSVIPIVLGSRPGLLSGTIRGELNAYFTTYLEEARERGLPLIRALPMQFPKDVEAAKVNDEFMLGDELLVTPMHENQSSRMVYLPMGIWTNLRDNQVFRGRQTLRLESKPDELPLFSRNGSILPLGSDPMKLHYFPRLGGEFFLFEGDLAEYSQVHASPAGDFMRLEIESKKDREYEWVVHHIERPRKIFAGSNEFGEAATQDLLRTGSWLYHSRNQNLHVRARAASGEDMIINISF